MLDKYCVGCHNDRAKVGNLTLQGFDLNDVRPHAAVLENVVRKLRSGMMPPAGRPRPDRGTNDQTRAWLENALDQAAAAEPNPGRTETFHRLSRTEYKNVIRDLLSLDIDVTDLLPADDSTYGFDNNAGLLKVNQTGMERYLVAARKVSRLAVGASVTSADSKTFAISPDTPQYDHVEGLPFGTRGGALIRYNFPFDGEYEFAIKLHCINTRGGDENCADGSSGFPDDHRMVVLIDGQQVQEFVFQHKPRRDRYSGDYGAEGDKAATDTERLTVRTAVKAGPREVGVTFVRLPAVETVQRLYRSPFEKPLVEYAVDRAMAVTVPHLSKVTISGPFDANAATDTPSRRAIFVCQPKSRADEVNCAKTILSTLARRAYRRPVSDTDVQPLLHFYKEARGDGESFDSAIEIGLRAILTSRSFWVRMEQNPPATTTRNAPYRISNLELASRLSFFLWSSMPDEQLLTLAIQGRLSDQAVLEQQVRRMLADSRASTLTTNFAEQWLNLRRIAVVQPDPGLFPNFDESLRKAFQQETTLFVDSIIREDHSALELLDSNYTFVNERLARHYGIPNVGGPQFRRVTLPADSPHRGLLGQGSILTVTSHATRTSPVKRGKWVLEQILGSPPPPPPPNVPELKEKQSVGKVLTMRERMAEHRANPSCAGCHAMLDPVGFALENFDPIGRYRTADENFVPVDPSGQLPNGTAFKSLAEFRAAIASQPDGFLLTLTEKLLTYALGRGAEYYDMPAIRAVLRDAAPSNYRMSSLILGIAKSVPFQMRNAAETPPTLSTPAQ